MTPPADRPRALRRLGQNFLANPSLARQLVARFAPSRSDRVVEIGPGRGAMTAELAARAGRFVGLELDERLVEGLRAVVATHAPRAEIRHADALEVDWDALARELGGALRVVGNLPYNVGTAIVRRLLAAERIADVQVVLQKEVCDRILAQPGTRAYAPLSIVAELRARRARGRVLPPGAFRPAPKVTSAVLRLAFRLEAPLAAHEVAWLESWLHRGFAQRRKTLARNLVAQREVVRAFLGERDYPLDARAEAVAPRDWLALARRVDTPPPTGES